MEKTDLTRNFENGDDNNYDNIARVEIFKIALVEVPGPSLTSPPSTSQRTRRAGGWCPATHLWLSRDGKRGGRVEGRPRGSLEVGWGGER